MDGRPPRRHSSLMNLRITGGVLRGRRLRTKRDPGLRPTSDRVRGAIFSILGPEVVRQARVLDLFAGTGALGIEALSRGAAWADFVEVDARRAQRIRESLSAMSLSENGRVYRVRAPQGLGSLPGEYNLLFVDPPYDMGEWDLLMDPIGRRDLLEDHGIVVVEHRESTRLEQRYGRLAEVTRRRYGDTAISIYEAGTING